MQPITTQILLHESPHADELLALILLRMRGEEMFPGVKTAEVTTFSGGLLKVEDLPENIIAIGTGGGTFDEHGKGGNICAATLTAEMLGLGNDRSLTKILAQTLKEDRNGASRKNEIPSIVKILHIAKVPLNEIIAWYDTVFCAERFYETEASARQEYIENEQSWFDRIQNAEPTTLESGFELVKDWLDEESAKSWKLTADLAIAKRQEMFLEAEKQWLRDGERHELNTPNGTLNIGFMKSDSPVMNSVARFCRPNTRWSKVDIFVQMNKDGNIQVFTDAKLNIDLTKLARNIRVAEAKKRGIKIKSIQSISMEGTHPEFPMWHLLEGSHSMLFNGSLSATMIEPTMLTPSELLEIIKETFRRKENRFQIPSSAFRPAKPVDVPVDPSVLVPSDKYRSLEGALVH
jgi:hypothetical protein